MEKIGVMQNNIRRSRLFEEREKQLFEVIKVLWNTHHKKSGARKFSEKATLEVTYKQPEFPVDPKTKKEDLIMEQSILDSGDTYAIKKLYPYKSDKEIAKMLKDRRKDRMEEAKFQAEKDAEVAKILQKAGIMTAENTSSMSAGVKQGASTSKTSSVSMDGQTKDMGKPQIDNRAKHSEKSSIQPSKTGDQRRKEKDR
jgi:hypothetical protein